MKSLVIGPSTGWLYAKGVNSLAEQKIVIEEVGARAVEFCLSSSLGPGDVRVASILCNKDLFFEDYRYKSLHLPDYNPNVNSGFQAKQAENIAKLFALTMVIHPMKYGGEYPHRYFERFDPRNPARVGSRRRLAIENMDRNKFDGHLLSDLEALVQRHQLLFVLDVQHAFEHDCTMSYATDLLEIMRGRLVHLHVSGESESSNHCLLHRAKNASVIVEFLGKVFSTKRIVPIILEGEYKGPEDLRDEILFIKNELGLCDSQ